MNKWNCLHNPELLIKKVNFIDILEDIHRNWICQNLTQTT